ncbi:MULTISPECIES: tail fiber domain-containing protein, partial [unclassified Methylococcus]|uniref:tail fiber domain-containing protein n=1 Tax=unclassified Methylococcus TaxID=2618889 RepID=UPI003D7E7C8A
GISYKIAREDHVHPFPTAAQVGAMATTHPANAIAGFGTSAQALAASGSGGSASTVARSDHVHPWPTAVQIGAMATTHAANAITGFGTSAQALAATQSAGTATTVARSDHRHPYPTAAQVGAAATYGAASNQFNADFFQATQDVGYRFANSTGSYAMSSTDGGVRVPVGGGFHVRNTSLAYVPCYASAFTVSSNRRLKRVLGNVRRAMERVRALQPIWYRLKANGPQGRIELGLIAEEALAVLPEVVYPVTDAANGPDGASLSIDYGRLAVLALAAIQELEVRVEALEATR